MKDKIILVTGATSGIGWASAVYFAKKELKVVAAGRNTEKGKALIEEIKARGGQAHFIPTDVSKATDVKHLVEEGKKHFGAIHYAFNNAGIEGNCNYIADAEESEWDRIMDTNLKGVWLSMKYEIPAIIEAGGGAIVNVSTDLVPRIFKGYGLYSATKAGVESLTKAAAVEYGPQKVRVNAVAPGAVHTPMIERFASSQEAIDQMAEANPLFKIAQPEEVAATAYMLLSSACSHVNGATLLVDGGSYLI